MAIKLSKYKSLGDGLHSREASWIRLLRCQQEDFTERLKVGQLLTAGAPGSHGESFQVSGDGLKILRGFCWDMAEKYKRGANVRRTYLNNLKGKLGEEIIKNSLGNLVHEVDYDLKVGGDGKVDFTLASDPRYGIQVKTRCVADEKQPFWIVSPDEIQRNEAIACILIKEEVDEAQSEYNLIFAGFLPTFLLSKTQGNQTLYLEDLLYSSGLKWFLVSLEESETNQTAKESNDKLHRTNGLELLPDTISQENLGSSQRVIAPVAERRKQKEKNEIIDNGTRSSDWHVGDEVGHEKYGNGQVTHIFGAGKHFCLAVKFKDQGRKIVDPRGLILKRSSKHLKDDELSSLINTSSLKGQQVNSPAPHNQSPEENIRQRNNATCEIGWEVGDMVEHKDYGNGEVTHIFGAGQKVCLAIKFKGQGRKIIDPEISSLKRVK
jgi:hypothetical protein